MMMTMMTPVLQATKNAKSKDTIMMLSYRRKKFGISSAVSMQRIIKMSISHRQKRAATPLCEAAALP